MQEHVHSEPQQTAPAQMAPAPTSPPLAPAPQDVPAAQERVTVPELVRALERIEAERAARADTLTIGEAVKELGLDVTPEQVLAAVRAGRAEAPPTAEADGAAGARAFSLARRRLRRHSRARSRLRAALAAAVLLAAGLAGGQRLWLAERGTDWRSQRLVQAANAGDLGLADRLLRGGADPNAYSVSNNNPTLWGKLADPLRGRIPALTLAANRGDWRLTELLLDHGADPNVRNYLGSTPLFYVANHREDGARYGAVADLLVARGADVNLRDWRGDTALVEACVGGSPLLVGRLLALGAADVPNARGATALAMARTFGHREAAAVLEAHGGR